MSRAEDRAEMHEPIFIEKRCTIVVYVNNHDLDPQHLHWKKHQLFYRTPELTVVPDIQVRNRVHFTLG